MFIWDETPCNQLKANQRFGETYQKHLQDFLLDLLFDPEDGDDIFFRQVR
jgi:hypothetical protein